MICNSMGQKQFNRNFKTKKTSPNHEADHAVLDQPYNHDHLHVFYYCLHFWHFILRHSSFMHTISQKFGLSFHLTLRKLMHRGIEVPLANFAWFQLLMHICEFLLRLLRISQLRTIVSELRNEVRHVLTFFYASEDIWKMFPWSTWSVGWTVGEKMKGLFHMSGFPC